MPFQRGVDAGHPVRCRPTPGTRARPGRGNDGAGRPHGEAQHIHQDTRIQGEEDRKYKLLSNKGSSIAQGVDLSSCVQESSGLIPGV